MIVSERNTVREEMSGVQQVKRYDFSRNTSKNQRDNRGPKRWSHQIDLRSLRGKPISVSLVSGGLVHGRLIEADQFTIKVALNEVADGKRETTYFKHAIVGYHPVSE